MIADSPLFYEHSMQFSLLTENCTLYEHNVWGIIKCKIFVLQTVHTYIKFRVLIFWIGKMLTTNANGL